MWWNKLPLVSSHLVQHRSTSGMWLWCPNMMHLSFTVASFSISHIATSKNQYQNAHSAYLVWNYMSNWRYSSWVFTAHAGPLQDPSVWSPQNNNNKMLKLLWCLFLILKKCGYLKISKNVPSLVFLYENVVLEQRIKRVIYKN